MNKSEIDDRKPERAARKIVAVTALQRDRVGAWPTALLRKLLRMDSGFMTYVTIAKFRHTVSENLVGK